MDLALGARSTTLLGVRQDTALKKCMVRARGATKLTTRLVTFPGVGCASYIGVGDVRPSRPLGPTHRSGGWCAADTE